ncbi:MAG: SHOCT domain-containing protein [Janthinobacterium lividum]
MNPSDANSPLATLRQLKEMLDAGTLTPQEFEALKQKLVFGQAAAAEIIEPASPLAAFIPPVSVSDALTSAPVLPVEESLPPQPTETPDWLAAAAPALLDHTPPAPAYEESFEEEKRNPLNLVFAIGGALIFLAVVLYLTLGNRAADEHLTSTTQTAADSTTVVPETGPQAQQLTLPPASPETIRVAPATPLPTAPAASKFSTDSSAVATPPVAAPAKPAAKPAPTTTVATDSAI